MRKRSKKNLKRKIENIEKSGLEKQTKIGKKIEKGGSKKRQNKEKRTFSSWFFIRTTVPALRAVGGLKVWLCIESIRELNRVEPAKCSQSIPSIFANMDIECWKPEICTISQTSDCNFDPKLLAKTRGRQFFVDPLIFLIQSVGSY